MFFAEVEFAKLYREYLNYTALWPHAFLSAYRAAVEEGGKAVSVYDVASSFRPCGSD